MSQVNKLNKLIVKNFFPFYHMYFSPKLIFSPRVIFFFFFFFTYFPTLTVDLCDIVGESWDPSPQEPFPGYGCQHPGWRVKTRGHDFYVCPGHSRGRSEVQKCGGPAERYCKAWGCETTRTLSFKIKTNDKEKGGNVGLPNCLMYFD